MTGVPLEASKIERFTPPSLANLPVPPVFLLKPPARRDREYREEWLLERRARYHGDDALRSQIKAGLREYWDAESAERFVPIVEQYWQAIDQHAEAVRQAGDGDTPEFVFDGPVSVEDIGKLFDDLAQVDDRYNRMLIDNRAYLAKAAMATMVFTIVGWEGVAAKYSRAGGCTQEDALNEAVGELVAAEMDESNAGIDGIGKPGSAMLALAARCSEMMFLTEEQRKNLQSPSPSTSIPAVSRKGGAARKGVSGKSPSPEPSTGTLAN